MGDKVRILVCSPYYLPHMGGLEIHAHEFNTHAFQRGHEVTVWTARLPKSSKPYEVVDAMSVYRYEAIELAGGFPVPAIWLPSFWRQYAQIFSFHYDFIISRTRFFLSSLLALCFAKIKHTPLIHIEHGSDYVQLTHTITNTLAYFYDKTLGRLVLQHANTVIANSQASALFVKRLTRNTVNPAVIYRGVDEKGISDTIPANRDSNNIIICYSGRLISGKGIQDLIQVIGQIKNSNIVCWIIGDGPMKSELEKLARKYNLQAKILFLGQMDNKRAISYIKACDIFVNPSYTEGIPTSVIEAGLCKKAIIATDVGGTNEIITNNQSGILLMPRDIPMLTNALEKLINDKNLRNALGGQAYQQTKSKFSWEKAMIQYEYVWNSR